MADIEIEINGQKLTAKSNQTVIQVADEAGIYIPRFCYHKKLSIPANCRMCLVEVEKAPKALPACATPCAPGMKIFTKSQKTILAQRAVMEFLLINHPLDCPICDQGGECELQDLSMGYGADHSAYDECKRSLEDQDLGPLIATEMTRCIYCTRCVRFGDEIAGMRELGAIGRGEHTEIDTYVTHAIRSEVSGNIIDLCPVGALTNKPYRFTARPWELDQSPSISPHDCIGSNLNVHTRYGTVMRVVTRENQAINEVWLADRDRFSWTGLYEDRLTQPRVKINGEWQTVSWQHAFEVAAQGLRDVIDQHGADALGALVSPNATLEELYLLQKIVRDLGSPHIDHRLRAINTADQNTFAAFPGLGMDLEAFEQCDAVFLIGSNLQKEQPIAALRLRKAIKQGASVAVLNPVDYQFNFKVDAKEIVAPQQMVRTLTDVLKAFETNAAHPLGDLLRAKQKVCVLLGALSMHHPEADQIRYLAQQIATHCAGTLGLMTDGANSAGAWLAGAIPHRQAAAQPAKQIGLSAYEMLAQPRKAYLLLNVEPEKDCANAHLARNALRQAECVIAFSMFKNTVLEETATVLLPISTFTETSGTFVNTMGVHQSFVGVAKSIGEARPAWKVLRVLGNFLHLDNYNYESSQAIKHEVDALIKDMPALTMTFSKPKTGEKMGQLTRIGEIPIYALDSLLRRAEPLQQTQTLMEGEVDVVRIHPKTAARLQLNEQDAVIVQQQNASATLSLKLDARIAEDAVWVAGGIAATQQLGDLFGDISLQKRM